MQKNIRIIFENNEEILNIISTHGEVANILTIPNEKCPLIGAEIKLTQQLQEGTFGMIFLITFPGLGTKQYVVKRIGTHMKVLTKTKQEWLKFDIKWKELKKFQSSKTIKIFENAANNTKITLIVPSNMKCLLTQDRIFHAIPQLPTIKSIKVPKNSYLCENELYSEYIISVYTGKIYRDLECINFFNVYSMFTCPNSDSFFNQYIFMDKIDGDLFEHIPCISVNAYSKLPNAHKFDVTNGIYIQTMFAIAMYQDKLKLSHNDLHTANVFLEFVTKDTTFNNQTLNDADWYHYNIKGKDIYFPAIPVIVKIGDYGFSIKFREPIVGPLHIFETGHIKSGWETAIFPNIFLPAYDSLFFTTSFIDILNFDNENEKSPISKLICNCVEFMCNKIVDASDNPTAKLI